MEESSLITYLLAQLKCSSCCEYMMYHIFQCHNGHNICDNCRPIMVHCLTCGAPLNESRNVFLERIADYITFPCLYNKEGCGQMLSKQNAALHQENCFHGPNRCPVLSSDSCPWKGSTREIEGHLLQKHDFLQAHMVAGFTTQCINIQDEKQWQLQFSAGNESFLRIFVIKGGEFYGYVKYLGPDKRAEHFRYKMQPHSQGGGMHSNKGIKTIFKGPVHPCKMSEETILKYGSCFRVSLRALTDLMGNQLELSVETSIYT